MGGKGQEVRVSGVTVRHRTGLSLRDKESLIHVGRVPSFDPSDGGLECKQIWILAYASNCDLHVVVRTVAVGFEKVHKLPVSDVKNKFSQMYSPKKFNWV